MRASTIDQALDGRDDVILQESGIGEHCCYQKNWGLGYSGCTSAVHMKYISKSTSLRSLQVTITLPSKLYYTTFCSPIQYHNPPSNHTSPPSLWPSLLSRARPLHTFPHICYPDSLPSLEYLISSRRAVVSVSALRMNDTQKF